jgi:hypothetical protein
MLTKQPLSAAVFAAALGLNVWATTSARAQGLPYDTVECDADEQDTIQRAVSEALSLLISNRQDEPGIEARVSPLFQKFFGVVTDSPTDADRSWNTGWLLSFSYYESFVNNSFTNPEQQTWPVQGQRITFRCNGTSFSDAAQLEPPSTILLEPSFTGKIPGVSVYAQLPLIEQSDNDTLAGTILHEMVHVYTGGSDICRAGQCVPSDQAEKNAAAHDPVVFSTPSNYEYFYQYSYPIAPEL